MARAKMPESKSVERRLEVQGLPEFLKRIKGECGLETVADIQPELPVRTMFTSYNRATGIGGHPMRRLVLMHGQNQSGKSALAMGIAESLRRAGQIPIVIDTEFAAEKRWYGELGMASEIPFFMTASMNEVVNTTTSLFKQLQLAKKEKKNKLDKNAGYCFVVDTITKLLPDDLLKTMEEKGVSKQYPYQAAMVSVWLQMLIPQLYRTNSTMILVTQERQNMNKANAFDDDNKPAGGQAMLFDSSLRVHLTSTSKVKEKDCVVGTGHRFKIRKNKSAGVSVAEGMIFCSNGHGDCPLGFDRAREIVEEAKGRGCVVKEKNDDNVTEMMLKVGDVVAKAGDGEELVRVIRADAALMGRIADALDKGEA